MADLLIKGMEMPIDCFHCAFEYDNECVADNDNRTTNLNGRPKWCPLVEVPTHGRLIDADELKELFRETITGIATRTDMKGAYEHMIRASAMVIEMIDDAPTVIEASEGGEQDA